MNETQILLIMKKIYADAMGAQLHEKVLAFTDDMSADSLKREELNTIHRLFTRTAGELGLNIRSTVFRSAEKHGAEPPRELWESVFGNAFVKRIDEKIGFHRIIQKQATIDQIASFRTLVEEEGLPDIIMAVSYFSTSHTLFRKFANLLGCRYASMPMIEMDMFTGPLNVDFKALEKETLALREQVREHRIVTVVSPSGTELIVEYGGRDVHADTGNLRARGSFGNLPAGEVYCAPLEQMTNGKFVAEWAFWGRLEKKLVLFVEQGKVVKMEGDARLKEYLEDIFRKDERNRVVAELGFGTNRGAKNPGNVLEAEKIYGTCHIAVGDNSTFGGTNKATAHLDYVIFDPEFRWDQC